MGRDKTPWLRFFRSPPTIMRNFVSGTPYFYKDPQFGYQRTILMGHEMQMVLFDIMMFSLWFMITFNAYLGLFLGYITSRCFVYLKYFLGQKNISRKALVDD